MNKIKRALKPKMDRIYQSHKYMGKFTQNTGSNYPPFPSGGGNPPYPPTPSSQPYPSQGVGYPGAPPYPSQPAGYPASSPYPPLPGQGPSYPSSSPFPGQGTSPYPSSSPYPGQGPSPYPSSAPYPGQGPSPYPQGPSPYPQGPSPYPEGPSPYPQGPSPYPTSSPYPGQGPSPYPVGQSTSPYPPAQQSGMAQGYKQFHPGSAAPYAAAGVAAGATVGYFGRPTVRASPSFDPIGDAGGLRKAMKGMGTDEKTIVQILGRRTSDQRQHILLKYQQAYGRDLVKDLKSELGGRFEQVIVAMMTPQTKYLAQELNAAMKGIGTKERVLIEILCTRDNHTIREIKAAYQQLYKCTLEKDIQGDTSGDFGRLMISQSTGCRDESPVNPSLAPGLAQELYKAGEKKVGTDEAEFNRILASYSYPMLRCVFDEYQKQRGKSFDAVIKSELSGDFRDGMLALYQAIRHQAAFFAEQLHNAMKGMGTNDGTLIRIVLTRSEIDMGNIKDEYLKMYNKRLDQAIKSETSGDYKNILLALVQD